MATVLIVEDEFLVRNVLQIELEEAGYDVILADNADGAIAILEARADIHLVFTDIDMPGSMDGLKLAACVRDRWPPIHIIITTGNARPREIPANAQVYRIAEDLWICELMKQLQFTPSTSEARRLVSQGAVRVDGRTITDVNFRFVPGEHKVLEVGKRRVARIEP